PGARHQLCGRRRGAPDVGYRPPPGALVDGHRARRAERGGGRPVRPEPARRSHDRGRLGPAVGGGLAAGPAGRDRRAAHGPGGGRRGGRAHPGGGRAAAAAPASVGAMISPPVRTRSFVMVLAGWMALASAAVVATSAPATAAFAVLAIGLVAVTIMF